MLVLAVGRGLAQAWGQQLAENSATIGTNLWWLVLSLVQSVVFAYLVYKVPGAVTSLVGSTAFEFGESFLGSAGGAIGESAQEAAAVGAKAAGKAAVDAAKASAKAASNLSQTVRAMILS